MCVPCGHCSFCNVCVEQHYYSTPKKECPICRLEIKSLIEVKKEDIDKLMCREKVMVDMIVDQVEECEVSDPHDLLLVDVTEECYSESASHRETKETLGGGGTVEVDFFGMFHVHGCVMFYRDRLCLSNTYI